MAAGRRRARRRLRGQLCRQPPRRRRRGDRRRRPGRAVAHRAAQRVARRRRGGRGVSRQLAGLQDPRLVHRRPAAGVQAPSPSGRLRCRPRGDLGGHLVLSAVLKRPRPFGVVIDGSWNGYALPSIQVPILAARPGQRPLRAGARGPLAAGRQVGGDRDRRAGRPGPGRARPRRPDRRAARRRHRRDHPAARLPLVHPQRGLPGQLPARPHRPPGRRRGPRPGHPSCPAGSARPGRRGGQAVRAGRLGRVHPAADQGQGRPADDPVRQAVRPQPPALGPVVQAGPGAAVRPPGGREGLQHRRPAGPAGGLCAAAAPRRRPAHAGALRGRRAHPRARVPDHLRVLRRRHGARRGRGRRGDHRPGPRHHPQAVGRRPGPPRHQAGQPAGPRRPHGADRRRLRPGAPEPLAPGRRPGQHDALPGPAQRPRSWSTPGPCACSRSRRSPRRSPPPAG